MLDFGVTIFGCRGMDLHQSCAWMGVLLHDVNLCRCPAVRLRYRPPPSSTCEREREREIEREREREREREEKREREREKERKREREEREREKREREKERKREREIERERKRKRNRKSKSKSKSKSKRETNATLFCGNLEPNALGELSSAHNNSVTREKNVQECNSVKKMCNLTERERESSRRPYSSSRPTTPRTSIREDNQPGPIVFARCECVFISPHKTKKLSMHPIENPPRLKKQQLEYATASSQSAHSSSYDGASFGSAFET